MHVRRLDSSRSRPSPHRPQNVSPWLHVALFYFQVARYSHASRCPSPVHPHPQCRRVTHPRPRTSTSIAAAVARRIDRGHPSAGSTLVTSRRHPPNRLLCRKASLGAPECPPNAEPDPSVSGRTKDTTCHPFCNPRSGACRSGQSLLSLSSRSLSLARVHWPHTRTSSKTNHDSNLASCSVRRYLSSTSPWSRTTSLLRLRYTPSIHWRVEDRSSSRWPK